MTGRVASAVTRPMADAFSAARSRLMANTRSATDSTVITHQASRLRPFSMASRSSAYAASPSRKSRDFFFTSGFATSRAC
jgi:hypothetical protein